MYEREWEFSARVRYPVVFASLLMKMTFHLLVLPTSSRHSCMESVHLAVANVLTPLIKTSTGRLSSGVTSVQRDNSITS